MDFLNTPEKKERRVVHLPMGRFGEAVEIAKAALFRAFIFLSSSFAALILLHASVGTDESSYMTVCPPGLFDRYFSLTMYCCLQGTDMKVDGGLTSAYVTPLGEPILPPPSSLV